MRRWKKDFRTEQRLGFRRVDSRPVSSEALMASFMSTYARFPLAFKDKIYTTGIFREGSPSNPPRKGRIAYLGHRATTR